MRHGAEHATQRPSTSSCSAIITSPASFWSRSGEIPYAARPGEHTRVQRVEREDRACSSSTVPGPNIGRAEADPLHAAEPPAPSRVDQLHPHEQSPPRRTTGAPAGAATCARPRSRRTRGCARAPFASAQATTATHGASRTSAARTHPARAADRPQHERRQQEQTSSGPRTATSISAMPTSPISTCWSMCTHSRWFSPTASIGETSPRASRVATATTKSTARYHGGKVGAAAAAEAQNSLENSTSASKRRQDYRQRRAPGCVRDEHAPRARAACAITMRCTSFVPSPISRIFWSR